MRNHTVTRMLLVMSFLTLGLLASGDTGIAQDKPGVATGQKIGNIIRAAIDTALPGVTSIVDLIWKKKETNRDELKKQDLQKAVDSAKKELQDQFTKNAQVKIATVQKVSVELRVVRQMLLPSVKAHENVIRMLTRLAGGNLSEDAIKQQETDWKIAKAQLESIGTAVRRPDVEVVRDLWLRNILSQILGVNNDAVLRVDPKASGPTAVDNLRGVASVLRDLTAAVGYELAELEGDVGDLASWAESGQGRAQTSLGDEFRQLLEKRYSSRR